MACWTWHTAWQACCQLLYKWLTLPIATQQMDQTSALMILMLHVSFIDELNISPPPPLSPRPKQKHTNTPHAHAASSCLLLLKPRLAGMQFKFPAAPSTLESKFPVRRFDGRTLSEAGFDLLSSLLTLDPDRRATAEEALNHRWYAQHKPCTMYASCGCASVSVCCIVWGQLTKH